MLLASTLVDDPSVLEIDLEKPISLLVRLTLAENSRIPGLLVFFLGYQSSRESLEFPEIDLLVLGFQLAEGFGVPMGTGPENRIAFEPLLQELVEFDTGGYSFPDPIEGIPSHRGTDPGILGNHFPKLLVCLESERYRLHSCLFTRRWDKKYDGHENKYILIVLTEIIIMKDTRNLKIEIK